MISDFYHTIEKTSEGYFKDKGSKFYAYAYPLKKEEEVKEIINRLKKENHSARHFCYAWRLGKEEIRFRANDDGEPSSSAGKPILGQLLSHDLTDILIVVIRYFGGTLLGVPGLINAYRTSAREAIEHGEIIVKTVKDKIQINFNYLAMNSVMKIIKDEEAKIVHQNYDNECEIHLEIRRSLTSRIIVKLSKVEKSTAPHFDIDEE